MNRIGLVSLAMALLMACPALAVAKTAAPVTAGAMLRQAEAQATRQHKDVLVVFHASWCVPCHMFERYMADPTIAPIMDKRFVTVWVDDGEHASDARHHDTPGAKELRAKLGGAKAGWPYIVMAKADGRTIVTSMRPVAGKAAENVGYPTLPVEIDWFMQMLHEAAPTMSPQETATVRRWLDQYETH